MQSDEFRELVWQKSRELYRDMPWRDEPTLYHVLVSELMLQQTQVARVLAKFDEFMQAFPTMEALAVASLADVLKIWTGLGYNRRAKFLHEAAKQIVNEPCTISPACCSETASRCAFLAYAAGKTRAADISSQQMARALDESSAETLSARLVALPGVGKNTAAAIMNYVYEIPTAYVETNIRTVYFHHFFAERTDVSDAEVLKLVDETMDREHPREWFWALMDYGAQLKSQGLGRLDVSKHYKKQSPLKGSVREVRGVIIHTLIQQRATIEELRHQVSDDARFDRAYDGLLSDGLIAETDGVVYLTE